MRVRVRVRVEFPRPRDEKIWMCSRSQARASFDALLLHMTAAMGTAAREGDLKVCVREATCKVQCAA